MRLKFPAARELRDGAIQDERVEKIDVIRNEKAGLFGIEARRSDRFDASTREENDPAAKRSLEPIVLSWMKDKREYNENWHGNAEVQKADRPEQGASNYVPGTLHMNTSTAP